MLFLSDELLTSSPKERPMDIAVTLASGRSYKGDKRKLPMGTLVILN